MDEALLAAEAEVAAADQETRYARHRTYFRRTGVTGDTKSGCDDDLAYFRNGQSHYLGIYGEYFFQMFFCWFLKHIHENVDVAGYI